MVDLKIRWIVATLVAAAVVLSGSSAFADDDDLLRVVVVDIPDGDNRIVADELSHIEGLELMPYDDFIDEVQSRAFNPDTILDNSSDLSWVMDGSNIGLIINFEVEDDQAYRVDFITEEDASSEHDFLADRNAEGAVVRGGAAIIRLELEQFLGERPQIVAEALAQADPAQQDDVDDDDDDADAVDPGSLDPEAMRQAAAEDEEAMREMLSRDWLWLRAHGRLFQKDFSAAAREAVYTHKSGGFPGYELEVEAFPLGMNNPDMADTGFYASLNHGLYGLTIVDETGDEPEEQDASVNNLTLEAGAVYRLDSPLDQDNRQLRFRIGGRYEAFSVEDNPEVPSTAVASLVLGTRLVLPLLTDELALTAGADIAPLAFFTTGEELFGEQSFSYGFGAELGAIYEVMDGGFLSGGYTFRMMRSDFDGAGEPFGHEAHPVSFEDSEVFDLNQGLRLGFIYQY